MLQQNINAGSRINQFDKKIGDIILKRKTLLLTIFGLLTCSAYSMTRPTADEGVAQYCSLKDPAVLLVCSDPVLRSLRKQFTAALIDHMSYAEDHSFRANNEKVLTYLKESADNKPANCPAKCLGDRLQEHTGYLQRSLAWMKSQEEVRIAESSAKMKLIHEETLASTREAETKFLQARENERLRSAAAEQAVAARGQPAPVTVVAAAPQPEVPYASRNAAYKLTMWRTRLGGNCAIMAEDILGTLNNGNTSFAIKRLLQVMPVCDQLLKQQGFNPNIEQ